MTEGEIYETLTEVMRDVFDNDDVVISPQTTAQDVQGWDSQAHVMLIIAVEQRLGIRFRASEYDQLHDVGEFVSVIEAKLQSK
ncbi:acyl carrier protein [Falsirhodobacter sp. 1013]|uniref:acyl carrier protein n=1 Tax=Falsirhodobacter sp. 1013 TaxID=3417566 RepID=UPI003EBF3C98